MLGIALRDIATFSQVNRALEAVGFEIIEAADRTCRMAQVRRGTSRCRDGAGHCAARFAERHGAATR